ncbi:MarR family winged helix-turn-helix transcriptional regulator [Bradyrhizobium manausense]|uniref:MarR family winged helix-turn-helix transcriptional regulator n=1 Tax=Bradyrhizobium manausense TaxID=989370 RepID=UPI0020122E9D|nr:MarR family transcriptional regulator [Bradyrhizobium manausense]
MLAARLRKVVGVLRRRMLREAGIGELTTAQGSVLLRLEQNGAGTVSALARAEGVTPQSMRITVAALQAAGHVTGRPDACDRRQTIISLTKGYRRWMSEARTIRQDWMVRRIEMMLTPREQETLATTLSLLDRLGED